MGRVLSEAGLQTTVAARPAAWLTTLLETAVDSGSSGHLDVVLDVSSPMAPHILAEVSGVSRRGGTARPRSHPARCFDKAERLSSVVQSPSCAVILLLLLLLSIDEKLAIFVSSSALMTISSLKKNISARAELMKFLANIFMVK